MERDQTKQKATRQRRRFWARSFGPYGCRVRVFETPSGILYAEERANGRGAKHSLGHRDRKQAEGWARQRQAELALAVSVVSNSRPTAGRIFADYLVATGPDKAPSSQVADRRTAALWLSVLGAERDLSTLSDRDVRPFMRDRLSGALNAKGEAIPQGERQPVRARTVGADLEFLRATLLWACKQRDHEGRFMLRENPLRDLTIPHEKNPRRPVATTDRYEALRTVSDQVTMDRRANGRKWTERSYLSELLDLAYGTGRRIGAIRALRFGDLQLDRGPHGSIRWRAEADKGGRESITPVAPVVRAALDRILRERPGLGDALLFPSPASPLKPVSKELASHWLERAERLAGLPKMDGSLWHAYRRGWATARKHLPVPDVAAMGGWKTLSVLQGIYQQPDADNMVRVALEPVELREQARR